MASNKTGGYVPFHTLDRQWDARFNVPTPEDLDSLLDAVKDLDTQGKLQYCLIGGVEVGDRPFQQRNFN